MRKEGCVGRGSRNIDNPKFFTAVAQTATFQISLKYCLVLHKLALACIMLQEMIAHGPGWAINMKQSLDELRS